MGKNKYIETPEKMWELFLAYRKEVKDNPIYLVEQKKGNTIIPKGFDGDLSNLSDVVELPAQRPLTMEGFENYCEEHVGCVHQYFANQEDAYTAYLSICSRIKRVIRQDQIEGGMVGIYNPSITQRLNGLVDRRELDHKGSLNIPGLPDIGDR